MVLMTNNNNKYNKIASNYTALTTCQVKHLKSFCSLTITITLEVKYYMIL